MSDQAGAGSTTDVAKHEAVGVKDAAVDAGQQVAEVAKDEAANVVAEAKHQARSIVQQTAGEVSAQAREQQQRLAASVHSYAKELGAMASASPEQGVVTDLAEQGARKAGEVANWLETHQPNELLQEVKAFARRRPIAFLVGAAVAGMAVGRLTRGMVAEARDTGASSTPTQPAQLARESASTPARPMSMVDEVPTRDAPLSEFDPEPEPQVLPQAGWPTVTGRGDVAR